MSAALRASPATYADLEALAPNLVGEIVNGELYASPRPAGPHTLAGSGIGGELWGPFRLGNGGPGGWWILDEPELHLRGDVLVPDLAGWRRERMLRSPTGAAIDLPPDWVCEVLSPSTARLDRAAKMPIYAREGVEWLWLVDPIARLLESYRRHEGRWLQLAVFGGNGTARVEPFEAIELKLWALWGEDGPEGAG